MIGCVLVIVVPMPVLVLDALLATNISLAVLILLTAMTVRRPMELSVFPSVLLGTTMLRLVLNVASTRLILTRGGTAGAAAAGGVIQKFGELVAGDRLIVGAVIFAILVVIQFVVITKGATRISEVAARFVLDAMPGRQMAIDSDLAAGLIDADTARRLRGELTRQTDFFGAMDGASKFIRGDAIAGLVITAVNVCGGLYVGMVESGMPLGDATAVFTKLTIGDGLSSQVPAFIIALATGLLVTRPSQEGRLSDDVLQQLSRYPEPFAVAAVFAGLMALTSFPPVPLLGLAGVFVAMAYTVSRSRAAEAAASPDDAQRHPAPRMEDLLFIEPLELELGYGLVRLADPAHGGDLMARLQAVRQEVAQRRGVILPKVRVRDNLSLGSHNYHLRVRGHVVAEGEAPAGRWLARNARGDTTGLGGLPANEAVFGAGARWIEPPQRTQAEHQGCEVLPPATALAAHLRLLVHQHAADLLSRDQVKGLLDSLRQRAPALVEELVPRVLSVGQVQRVLQYLLTQGESVRDLESILEILGDHAAEIGDIDRLAETVRARFQSRRSAVREFTAPAAMAA
jgi:flagellar biosynthesis protein FlhA